MPGENARDGPSRHLVHRPVGRPDPRSDLQEGRRVGLRRHRAPLLGRPLQRPEGPQGRQLLPGAPRPPRPLRPEVLGDLEPPRRPARPRHPRRPHRRLGTRRHPGELREEAGLGDPGDEGHRPRRQEARRAGRQRLHRVVDLAPAVLVPARLRQDDRRRLQAPRRALEPDPGCVQGVRRQVRAGGPPDRDRLRHLLGRDRAQGARPPAGVRVQLRPQPPALAVRGPGRVHPGLPGPDLPRPRQGRRPDARRQDGHPRLAPELRRPPPRLGLPLAGPRPGRLRGDRPRPQPD